MDHLNIKKTMKKLILIILFTFIYIGYFGQKKINYEITKGKVVLKAYFFKIDTLQNLYTYHFKSDSIEGIFTKPINKNFSSSNYKRIKLNKKYILILNKQLYDAHVNLKNLNESIYEDDILIWKTGMKSQYFTDCENIKGGLINTKFTLTKY